MKKGLKGGRGGGFRVRAATLIPRQTNKDADTDAAADSDADADAFSKEFLST